jgi:hypothetical protein
VNLLQVAVVFQGVHQQGHHLFPVADGQDVHGRVVEPGGVPGNVVAAHHDQGLGLVALDLPGREPRAVALGGEIALDAHQRGVEGLAFRQPGLGAVDAHIHDLALVTLRLQHPGHAFQAQGFHECDHLQPENAFVGGFDEGDLHGSQSLVVSSRR